MDNNCKYFLKILEAYIKGSDNLIINNDINWDKIYELAKINSLQGIIYTALNKLKIMPSGEAGERLSRDFLITSRCSLMQEIGMNQVIEILNAAQIPHILYKGFVIRDYYPVKETRTMGDIDFVIRPEDREKANELLIRNGFAFHKDESDNLVWNYLNKFIYLEMHTSLIHQMIFSEIDFAEYFQNPFEHSIHKNKYTYELQKEYHFIFLLVHLAKHFYHIGAGIRMFLDLSIFSNYFKEDMNWSWIFREIDNLKLTDFADKAFYICNNFLGANMPQKKGYKSALDFDVIEYILQIGVFGHNRKTDNMYEFTFGTMVSENAGSLRSRLKLFMRLLFPSANTVLTSNEPKWHLPIVWAKRWHKILFQKRYLLSAQLKGVFCKSDEAVIHNYMLKRLGLIKK